MKIGFSSNAYTRKSLTYAIQSISDIGYDGIEIVLDIPHAFLPLSESTFQNIQKCLEKCKITVTNLNANTVAGWYEPKNYWYALLDFEDPLEFSEIKNAIEQANQAAATK